MDEMDFIDLPIGMAMLVVLAERGKEYKLPFRELTESPGLDAPDPVWEAITEEHLPELCRFLADRDLWEPLTDEYHNTMMAAILAARRFDRPEVIDALMEVCRAAPVIDSDYIFELLPRVMGGFGERVLPFLDDLVFGEGGEDYKSLSIAMLAGDIFTNVWELHPGERPTVERHILRLLDRSDEIHTTVIAALVFLLARAEAPARHADRARRLFDAGEVDLWQAGDYQDWEIAAGLRTERSSPRAPLVSPTESEAIAGYPQASAKVNDEPSYLHLGEAMLELLAGRGKEFALPFAELAECPALVEAEPVWEAVTEEHVPELCRFMVERDLWEPFTWVHHDAMVAAIHAAGRFDRPEVIDALLFVCRWSHIIDSDDIYALLPEVLAGFGPTVLPAVEEWIWIQESGETLALIDHLFLGDVLEKIWVRQPDARPALEGRILRLLERSRELNPNLNSILVFLLAESDEPAKYADFVRARFVAGDVALWRAGDYEDWEVDAGLRTRRATPRPQYIPQGADPLNYFEQISPDFGYAGGKRPSKSERAAKSKQKAKRKQQRKARKKNRK